MQMLDACGNRFSQKVKNCLLCFLGKYMQQLQLFHDSHWKVILSFIKAFVLPLIDIILLMDQWRDSGVAVINEVVVESLDAWPSAS